MPHETPGQRSLRELMGQPAPMRRRIIPPTCDECGSKIRAPVYVSVPQAPGKGLLLRPPPGPKDGGRWRGCEGCGRVYVVVTERAEPEAEVDPV